MVAYRQDETARLAQDMPRKDLTVTQDETFTGGLCLVTMDPDSNFILVEQLAQARAQGLWHALMAPALAQLNCRVIQSTGTHLRRDTVIPQWFQASKAAAASDGHAVHC